ncbi:hypothetical protein MKEN_01106400 [Mycena kentingensis (nom. inval.)]|nr:hypothetical protein MKEN_01106400 [Mycena kentingensis (nom. inval.)]
MDHDDPAGDSRVGHARSKPAPQVRRALSDPVGLSPESMTGIVSQRSSKGRARDMAPQHRERQLTDQLREAERTLNRKISEYESIHDDLQMRLDQASSELDATKREEKELRDNERVSHSQIQQLETEVAKLSQALEIARVSYTTLQKQYQDQLVASEGYRAKLRERDNALRTEREAAARVQSDGDKLGHKPERYKPRDAELEEAFAHALHVRSTLDAARKENLLLNETIDGLRLDLDELRSSVANGRSEPASSPTSTRSSGSGTLVEHARGFFDSPPAYMTNSELKNADLSGGANFQRNTIQNVDSKSEYEMQIAALVEKARIDLFGEAGLADPEPGVRASAPTALLGSGVLPHTRLEGGIFKNFGNISGSHIEAPTIMPVIAPGAQVRDITITQTNAALDILVQAQQAYNDLRSICVHARYSAANTPAPCPAGTRVIIIEDIIQRLADTTKTQQVIYLGGSPDFDYSSIAKSIAQKLAARGTLAASFFFSSRVSGRGEASALPLALAYQLGQYSAKFRAELGLRLLADPQLMYDDPTHQLDRLVINILNTLEQSKIHWVICLDALDVCVDGDVQTVIRWLEEYPLPRYVRLLLTGGSPMVPDCLASGSRKGMACLLELNGLDEIL